MTWTNKWRIISRESNNQTTNTSASPLSRHQRKCFTNLAKHTRPCAPTTVHAPLSTNNSTESVELQNKNNLHSRENSTKQPADTSRRARPRNRLQHQSTTLKKRSSGLSPRTTRHFLSTQEQRCGTTREVAKEGSPHRTTHVIQDIHNRTITRPTSYLDHGSRARKYTGVMATLPPHGGLLTSPRNGVLELPNRRRRLERLAQKCGYFIRAGRKHVGWGNYYRRRARGLLVQL